MLIEFLVYSVESIWSACFIVIKLYAERGYGGESSSVFKKERIKDALAELSPGSAAMASAGAVFSRAILLKCSSSSTSVFLPIPGIERRTLVVSALLRKPR